MPDTVRPKRESLSPLRRKLAKWTTIVTTVASCVAGVVVLTVQTCGEIRDTRAKANKSEMQAVTGYETLQPAVKELQALAADASKWSNSVDENIDDLHESVRECEMQLAKHEAYFDMLKTRYAALRREPEISSEDYEHPLEPTRPVPKYNAPRLDTPPPDLEQLVQQKMAK
jgi:negative regulator of sigma E activity